MKFLKWSFVGFIILVVLFVSYGIATDCKNVVGYHNKKYGCEI